MKLPFPLLLSLTGIACFSTAATAASYSTSFDGFTIGDLDGQGGWSVDDPTADAGYVQSIAGSPWNGRAATLGFVAPLTNDDVYASHSVVTGLAGTTFSVVFQVQDSDSGFGDGSEARDTFGFRLENGSGTNLFSFFLNPFDQAATPESDTGFHTFGWNTGAGGQTVALNGTAAQELFAYTLNVTFSASGVNDIAFLADVNGSSFGGILPGLGSQSIGEVGAFWNTLNGADSPGSNFLIFDNVSIVPEPSVALLGMIGAFAGFRRRRN